MDNKQIPNNKIAAEEILKDSELDSVVGGFGLGFALFLCNALQSLTSGNNIPKKGELSPFMKDFDGKKHDYGQTGAG
ncbi:MAG: hypothetical protein IKD73_00965 [Selenomonadaceae bacterium]|nr:hypothetical protein [Selenomonadaceae bacterium]